MEGRQYTSLNSASHARAMAYVFGRHQESTSSYHVPTGVSQTVASLLLPPTITFPHGPHFPSSNIVTYCSDANKTKFLRPIPPEVNKGTWRISLLSKWTPLLISTVVMFQAQNREAIVLEKLLCPSRSLRQRAWQDRFSQHNTRSARSRPRPIFWSQTGLVLRPSDRRCQTTSLTICLYRL